MTHAHRWAVRAEGDTRTLQGLTHVLTGNPARLAYEVVDGTTDEQAVLKRLNEPNAWPMPSAHPGYILRSSELDALDDAHEVAGAADAILHRAVAFLNVFVPSHRHVTVGPVTCPRSDGTNHGYQISLIAEIRVVSEKEAQRIEDDTQWLMASGAKGLAIAHGNDRAAEVLSFLTHEKPAWGEMYAAIEAVSRELADRGYKGKEWKAIAGRGWCAANELTLFKQTANLYRHARGAKPPKPPMPLQEAQWLVKSIVRQWLRDLP